MKCIRSSSEIKKKPLMFMFINYKLIHSVDQKWHSFNMFMHNMPFFYIWPKCHHRIPCQMPSFGNLMSLYLMLISKYYSMKHSHGYVCSSVESWKVEMTQLSKMTLYSVALKVSFTVNIIYYWYDHWSVMKCDWLIHLPILWCILYAEGPVTQIRN